MNKKHKMHDLWNAKEKRPIYRKIITPFIVVLI